MRFDIVPGAVFPDYELTDYSAKRLRRSEFQQHDPMILILSGGGFCPNERRQHEGLVQLDRLLEIVYCVLVTITTDNVIETNEFHSGIGARWTFRSDDSVCGSAAGRSLLLNGGEIDGLSQQPGGTPPVTHPSCTCHCCGPSCCSQRSTAWEIQQPRWTGEEEFGQ